MNIEFNSVASELGSKLSDISGEIHEPASVDFEKPIVLASQEANSSAAGKDISFQGINAGALAYGLRTLSEQPIVKEWVDGFKSSATEKVEDFFKGIYENVVGFFTTEADKQCIEDLGEGFVETRDFGLDKCSEAAKEIFNPGIIENWSILSQNQRCEIAGTYAAEVAKAFDLVNYSGVFFEDLEPGTLGYNNGDGSIHLSNELVKAWTSPLEIMNTITHELRHQYQSEAVLGYHNVSDDVRLEWSTAQQIYNYDQPYCYDPWGYTYNPLEIDARFAGETVVRNVTHDMINS